MRFKGTVTALITPFKEDGSVDYDVFRKLCIRQAENGCHLMPCGTTGESPTLSHEEHRQVNKIAVEVAKLYPEIKVVAGVGSNNTREAIQLVEHALEIGADYGLSVIPYYNKPTQEGHFEHQKELAKVGLRLIVYNIPGRCGTGLTAATILRMAELDNIVGLKAAAGVNDDLSEVLMHRPEEFSVFSGDDTLTYYMMAAGADGAMSVTSNTAPKQVAEIVNCMLDGDYSKGLELTKRIFKLYLANMRLGTNPEVVKESIDIIKDKIGLSEYCAELRLPLRRINSANRSILENVINETGYF